MATPPPSSRIGGRELLVGETSALFAFSRCGHAHTVLAWFGDYLHVTREVYDEIVRNRRKFPANERYLDYLARPGKILELSDAGRVWVARIAPLTQTRHDHPGKNVGELSTARMAQELRQRGRDAIVLVDDREGLDYCRRLAVPVVQTRAVIVDMVREEALSESEARRLWRALKLSDAVLTGALARSE